MTSSVRPWAERFLLPLSLGIADGIVNALTLASSAVIHGSGLTVTLALRVAAVALVSSVFTVFVAEYGQLRAELARAERELSFTRSGRLAAGHLGRQVAREAAVASAVASGASFAGALIPLAIGAAAAAYSWSALVISVGALGALGGALAAAVGGSRRRWIIAMMVMGVAVAAIGTVLDITLGEDKGACHDENHTSEPPRILVRAGLPVIQ
jgi:VIT1/CCC1 family predicted Fe2+/Mn2+ transporter